MGAGGYMEPRYSGAEDTCLKFLPVLNGSLRMGKAFLFVDTSNGCGIGLRLGESVPLSLTAGVQSGQGRDSSLASALDELPDLKNIYRLFGKAKITIPRLGDLSLGLTYVPISVEDREGETEYDGILVDVSLSRMFLLGGFALIAGIGVEGMNADYARTYYGIEDATADRERYEAGTGIKSATVSLSVSYMFSERVGGTLFGFGECLVGDAAKSPVADSSFQPTVGALAFYRF